MESISLRRYLRLAIPFMLATMTQPLLGAVDTAVVGRLDSPVFIGGVAVGTVIFNTIYWLFGFLRVATSGFSAQSLGQNRPEDMVCSWLRPLCIATLIGLTLTICQLPLHRGAMAIYHAEPDVARCASQYFHILIWGAPLVLIHYVNLGWLMGRGLVRHVLVLQIGANILNILLDLLFVLGLHLAVPGVAAATLIAQIFSFLLGCHFVLRQIPRSLIAQHAHKIGDPAGLKKILAVNGDFFIRTLCLMTMTNIFVARGAGMGSDVLAANAILFQLQYLMASLFDGLANAASVFAGRSVGSRNRAAFFESRNVAARSMCWLGAALALLLLLGPNLILRCFTDLEQVLGLCRQYMFYLILYVPAMAPGLVWYGLFSGATCTAPIRNSTIAALLIFLVLVFTLIPLLHNHGLWIAFIAFCIARSVILIAYWNRMVAQSFPQNLQPAGHGT